MATPRVSIGLTVDNGGAHLEAALDSLLGQTFGDYELIISDDGSTDRTESICRSYVARDPRVRYYRQEEKRGPIWNSNRAFELSSGEYFKWATYDDVCDPAFLARCVEVLDSDSAIAWCHTLTRHIDWDGRVLPGCEDPAIPQGRSAHSLVVTGSQFPPHTRCSARPHERFCGVLLGTNWCSDGYGLIRRDVLLRTGLLRPCYGPGKVLMAEISLLGRFQEVPEVLFFERIRPQVSGKPTASAGQYAMVHPSTASRFSTTRLRLLWEYVHVIRRAELPATEKARCLCFLARYLFQAAKWKRVLVGFVRRAAEADCAEAAPNPGDRTPPDEEQARRVGEPVSTA